MNTLPIVERELRVASRRAATWWLRVIAVVLGLAMAGALYYSNPFFSAVRGLYVMRGIGVVLETLALLSGCFLTADCISSERREGTLGLLFLTPIGARDIVLGKLTAAATNMAYGLVGVLPVLFLSLLVGGVSVAEVVRTAVVIVSSLFLSLSLGMFFSRLTHHSTRAAMATLVVLVLLTFLPVLALVALREITGISLLQMGIPTFSPFHALQLAAYSGVTAYAPFMISVASLVGLGLLLLLTTIWRLNHTWRSSLNALEHRVENRRSRKRRRDVPSTNPWEWLVVRRLNDSVWSIWFRRLCWTFFLVDAVLILASGVKLVSLGRNAPLLLVLPVMFTLLAFHIVNGLHVILETSRLACEEARSGSLEQIMATPMPEGMLVDGFRRGFDRAFRGVACSSLLAGVFVFAVFVIGADAVDFGDRELPLVAAFLIGGGLVSFLNFKAIYWVSLLSGLKARTPLRAAMNAMLIVHLLPWAGFVITFIGLMGSRIGIVITLFWTYYVVAATYSLVVRFTIRQRVRLGFRPLVVAATN